MSNAVELKGVCCGYAEKEILHDLSFALPRNSLTGIVGPNGGGKTTLLRLLLGIIAPTEGEISILGVSPQKARARIGYVPQRFDLDERFPITVEEVVLMGRVERHLFGGWRRSDRAAAAKALARVELDGARFFADLSGGERQRALIAAALAADPELLLLDEPTANVDALAASSLHQLFAELAKQITVIMVSHNLHIVSARATHVLCVNHGAQLHKCAELASSHPSHLLALSNELLIEHDAQCAVMETRDAPIHSHAQPSATRP